MNNKREIIDYVCAGMLIRHKDWRAGQGLFNAIDLVCPDIGNEIRGTKIDPFHDNAKLGECWEYVVARLSGELWHWAVGGTLISAGYKTAEEAQQDLERQSDPLAIQHGTKMVAVDHRDIGIVQGKDV